MVTRTTTYDYEQSSEAGRERMVRIPYARLVDATPTLHDPAAVICAVLGQELIGTVISLDATNSEAILNTADGAVFKHNVRNVITYGGGPAEASWRALNVGDKVYYDDTATMPTDTKLSTSPLDGGGNANPVFGTILLMQDEVASDYPKGSASVGSTHVCAIRQEQ